MEAVSTFLEHGAGYLDDGSMASLLSAACSRFNTDSASGFFESRCFGEGYAVKIDKCKGHERCPRMNYRLLYKINADSVDSPDASVSYVQVGDVLISVPVTNVGISDMIGHIYSTTRSIVEKQFILYHMAADGSPGHECIPGQSGSRFVARISLSISAEDQSPLSPRSRVASQRLRRNSIQACRALCLRCACSPGPTTSRSRQYLRESSDVHSYRHYLFRSNSAERPTCPSSTHIGDRTRSKILSLFFSSTPVMNPEEATSPVSRWTTTGGGPNSLPTSSVFVFHSPGDFDLNKLRFAPGTSPILLSPLITDSSPQSTPFTTTSSNEINGSRPTNNLMSMIQELISRRVLSDGVSLEVPLRNVSAPLDNLFGVGHSHRQREELRRLYAPMNGHIVSRTVAVSELSRTLAEPNLNELLSLAENQGYKDRPLLVQLAQGQWRRLSPKDFRLAAHMLGPTPSSAGHFPPLPELNQGGPALDRMASEFSSKCLSNTKWQVKIKFDPFTHPTAIGTRISVGQLTVDDCRRGFKLIPDDGGVIVTTWAGLVDESTSQVICMVDRSASVADLLNAFKNRVKLRHGLSWADFQIDFLSPVEGDQSSLTSDLHWCASEYLSVSLSMNGRMTVARCFDDPFESPRKKILDETTMMSQQPINGDGEMLWESVGSWNADETRNTLAQWASRGDVGDESSMSPTSRRRRLTAKAASGGPINRSEAEELGVDFNTEYARWWVTSNDESETDLIVDRNSSSEREIRSQGMSSPKEESKRRVRLSLPPQLDEGDVWLSPKSCRSPIVLSPKTPLSPISRSRRQSSIVVENETRVLRSTRDTRQFEFHPFDPNLILTGSRSGVISLIDAEKDVALMQTRVDSSPILGLSWLRAHMNVALYGASSSGLVGVIKLGDTSIDYQGIGRFQNLSSVSINCTDDYFVVSGFSRDVSLFDMISGKKVSEFKEIHSNFINITRFANFSPHMYV